MLRHRSTLATSIYTKVDDNALQVFARPCPDLDTAVKDRERTALLASLQLAFEHREVVHELLHAGPGRSGSCWVVRSSPAAAVPPSLSARRTASSLAQERVMLSQGRIRTVHVVVGHVDFPGTTTDSRQTDDDISATTGSVNGHFRAM